MNLYGVTPSQLGSEPVLHGCQITLSAHNLLPLPPVGVFNWHYLQCVLKKFATVDYKAINNINNFSFPFCTRDDNNDSDIDFDDERNIVDPPYPSYLWDLAFARAHRHMEVLERDQAILTWNASITTNDDPTTNDDVAGISESIS